MLMSYDLGSVVLFFLHVALDFILFFSSIRLHTIGALVTGVHTCALPIWRQDPAPPAERRPARLDDNRRSRPPSGAGCTAARPRHPPVQPQPDRTADSHGLTAPAVMVRAARSEEHTSELPSLMRISYAVFCLQKHKT